MRDTDTSGGIWNRTTHAVNATAFGTFTSAFDGASAGKFRYDVPAIYRNAGGAIRHADDSSVAPGAYTRAVTFDYDAAARLVQAQTAGYEFQYAYDAVQNMTRRETTSGTPALSGLLSGTYTYGGTGYGPRQISAVGTTTFDYDPAGRVIRAGVPGVSDVFADYDSFDRVRVLNATGGADTLHQYGFDGERCATLWGATLDIERYFEPGVSERHGRLEVDVGLGGARLVAKLAYPVSGSDEVVTYLHQGLGPGPAVVTDMDGELLEERFFEPYGAEIGAGFDADLDPHGWNGKPIDPDTRWSDHGARWAGTNFGRWLSPDPPLRGPAGLMEQGLGANPYGFVAGNPVAFWDPDGGHPYELIADAQERSVQVNGRAIDLVEDLRGAPAGTLAWAFPVPAFLYKAVAGLVGSGNKSWEGAAIVGACYDAGGEDCLVGNERLSPRQVASAREEMYGGIVEVVASVELGRAGGAEKAPAAEEAGRTLRGTNEAGQVTSRGSWRRATVDRNWEGAEPGPTGGRLCPTCKAEVRVAPRSGQPRDWDINHDPPWTKREFSPNVTRKEVLDNYQEDTWLECPSCNRSAGNRR